MKRKKKASIKKKKKKQNFSNCRTSALGLSPSCLAARRLSVSLACSLCMQQQWQPTGADIFLKQPPGCCVWRSASSAPAWLVACHLGFRAKEIARLQFGHTTLPGYVFHLLLLLICVTSSPPLLILHPPCYRRNRRTLMNNSLRSGSTYPYRCASPLKFPPSSVCTCHLHFNGNAF